MIDNSQSSLKPTPEEIEKGVGKFGKYAGVKDKPKNTKKHSDPETNDNNILYVSLSEKPATQFLSQAGCEVDLKKPLTEKKVGAKSPKKEIVIKSDKHGMLGKKTLKIPAAHLEAAQNSAKVYVNSDVIPHDVYMWLVKNNKINPQEKRTIGEILREYSEGAPKITDEIAKRRVLHAGMGVCHAQKIHVFVEQELDDKRVAKVRLKSGKLEQPPKLLLLSTPAFNSLENDLQNDKRLSSDQRIEYIKSMFYTLLKTAKAEGYKYLALPPAGIGAFGGIPEEYYRCLFEVASLPEFKSDFEQIFYNPGKPQDGEIFDKIAAEHSNLVIKKSSADMLLLADQLSNNGYPCAYHNPSDSDVVFGVYDVGEYWKGENPSFVGEEFVGTVTSAAYNSRGINPECYANPIEISSKQNELSEEASVIIANNLEDLKKQYETPSKEKSNSDNYDVLEKNFTSFCLENMQHIKNAGGPKKFIEKHLDSKNGNLNDDFIKKFVSVYESRLAYEKLPDSLKQAASKAQKDLLGTAKKSSSTTEKQNPLYEAPSLQDLLIKYEALKKEYHALEEKHEPLSKNMIEQYALRDAVREYCEENRTQITQAGGPEQFIRNQKINKNYINYERFILLFSKIYNNMIQHEEFMKNASSALQLKENDENSLIEKLKALFQKAMPSTKETMDPERIRKNAAQAVVDMSVAAVKTVVEPIASAASTAVTTVKKSLTEIIQAKKDGGDNKPHP